MKKIFIFLWDVIRIVVLALAVVIPIRYFIFQPFFVQGQSMDPNFATGDYLIVDEISYRFLSPQRGDVIVFKYPHDPSKRYIKRVIGLPGETLEIKDGKVMIFNEKGTEVLNESTYLPSGTQTLGNIKVTLSESEYFVLGDNRSVSSDSRRWGTLPRNDIIGRVLFRAWPFTVFAKIEAPDY